MTTTPLTTHANKIADTLDDEASKSRLRKERDQLIDDLKKVVGDAQSLLKASHEELLEDKIEAASSSVKNALEKVRGGSGQLQEGAQKQLDCVDSYVQRNPWTAAGIALGAGVFIGLLLRRR